MGGGISGSRGEWKDGQKVVDESGGHGGGTD